MQNSAPHSPRPLGPLSEVMFIRDTEDCPHSGYSYLTFHGPLDIEALRCALRSALSAFPVLAMRLERRRIGLRHLLVRVPVEEPPPLSIVDDYAESLGGMTIAEALKRRFEPRYLKRMDLFREPPCEFFLFRFPDSQYALAPYFHHTGVDGGSMTALFRCVFGAYHEKATGKPPDWAEGESIPSSAAKATRHYSTAGVLRQMIAEAAKRRRCPVIRFGNRAESAGPRRNIVRIDLSEEETKEALKKARSNGLTFNDLLSCATIRAVDAMLGTPHGTFSFWMPVNVRGGVSGAARTNNTSSVNIDLIRGERLDERTLVKTFAARRKRQINIGRAYVNFRLLEFVLGAARFFPVEKRQRPLKKLFERPMTFMSSNMGVLWPKFVDGRLTAQSYMANAGGLEITDYMADFSSDDSLGHGMISWTFRGKFTAAFSAKEQVISRGDAETLMNLIKRFLIM